MAIVRSKPMQQIYVWELPVRIYHWINFVCIVVLAATGYLVGSPVALKSTAEASNQYWFGTIRFVHFTCAYVFLFNFLFRLYWGFAGNEFASWKNFIPHNRAQWKELADVLRIDILQTRQEPLHSMGHNALAGVTYFMMFLAFAFQVVTGFGMYAAMSTSWFPQLFAWIVPLMGGDFAVRQWHHMMMWFFIIVGVIHIHLVFYHDYVEGRGTTSSMVGGWKFIDVERVIERIHSEVGPRKKKSKSD
ncbi:MAG: Ni/Fe-hydrogenase, b-type cytochrome subunit [Candidatus Krumholzibacteria bacterium]|nr:Ni/Fe-hydrogenase, b-type cytochrome subunit [Candidatus Krumholzibacteria bacterium]